MPTAASASTSSGDAHCGHRSTPPVRAGKTSTCVTCSRCSQSGSPSTRAGYRAAEAERASANQQTSPNRQNQRTRYDVPMELSLATRVVSAHTVLEVVGEVDVYTAPKLRERISELLDGVIGAVIVDLSKVDFMDSTGLGVLVGGFRKSRTVR